MRVVTMALMLVFSSVAVAGDATAPAQGAKEAPDPRVRAQLDELKYEYEVDEDGDYKLVFNMGGSTDKRSQLVYVRSPIESYGVLSVREIWSPGFKSSSKEFPAGVANRLLAANHQNKLGSWAKQDEYAVFVIRIPADATTKQLDAAIDAAVTSADEIEAELTPGKDDL